MEREKQLHDWLEQDVSILGLDIMVMGREVLTAHNGRIDMLAIDSEGLLYILELKKNRTPREVVAQVLDYASWVSELESKEVYELATDYFKSKSDQKFEEVFIERFGCDLPEELNSDHDMIIIGSEMDEASKRIVKYLAEVHDLRINTAFFDFFRNGDSEFLVANWLLNQDEVRKRSDAAKKAPWTGYYYVNVDQNWDDCMKFGFLSAGGGRKYSKPLESLKENDNIFAYQRGHGYVGYGLVKSAAVVAKDFEIAGEKLPDIKEHLTRPSILHDEDNTELADYVVGVRWFKSFPLNEAKWETGWFANQNIVCKLRHPKTVEDLKKEFGVVE